MLRVLNRILAQRGVQFGVGLAVGVIALVVVTGPVQAVSAGLFSYWKFDELSPGSTVNDSTSSGYNGTPYGSGGSQNLPQPSTDVPPTIFTNPRSLLFDGNDDYVDISNWGADTSNGFTVSLWAKPTANKNWARFIDFGNGLGSDNIVFSRLGGSSDLQFEVYSGSTTNKIIAPGGLINGSWHHYAATIDGAGNGTIYRDGVALVTGVTGNPVNIPRANKYVGKSNWNDDYFEGQMDELRFYDRALAQNEIDDLRNGEEGAGVTPADDNDGVAEAIENAAPNNGDGNNDVIPDAQQPNVASFVSAVTGKYVTLEVDDDCNISSVAINTASTTAPDRTYTYPAGLMDFRLICGTPGFEATINQYYHGMANSNYVMRKYNPSNSTYTTIDSASINLQTTTGASVIKVNYKVTDGGILDLDGSVNGEIIDPAGLGTVASVTAVGAPNTGFGPTPIASKITNVIIGALISTIAAVSIYEFRKRQNTL